MLGRTGLRTSFGSQSTPNVDFRFPLRGWTRNALTMIIFGAHALRNLKGLARLLKVSFAMEKECSVVPPLHPRDNDDLKGDVIRELSDSDMLVFGSFYDDEIEGVIIPRVYGGGEPDRVYVAVWKFRRANAISRWRAESGMKHGRTLKTQGALPRQLREYLIVFLMLGTLISDRANTSMRKVWTSLIWTISTTTTLMRNRDRISMSRIIV